MDIEKFLEDLNKKYKVDTEVLKNTPRRWKGALEELTEGYNQDPSKILKKFICKKEKVEVSITTPFFSLCEHHILPFYGKVILTYFPDKYLVGLSKVPRLVRIFSKRLQLQERLTNQIASVFFKTVKPKWVTVEIKGIHLCCQARGASIPATMRTKVRKEKTDTESVKESFSENSMDIFGGRNYEN